MCKLQKYKIIGAIFQSLGCAVAHPGNTLDPRIKSINKHKTQ